MYVHKLSYTYIFMYRLRQPEVITDPEWIPARDYVFCRSWVMTWSRIYE